MIRVERREFSGLKIYDSLLCKFFSGRSSQASAIKQHPKLDKIKFPLLKLSRENFVSTLAKLESGVALIKLLRHCWMALWRTLNASHRISVHSQNELLKY